MAQDILITPGSGEPQILFRGSGTTDTAIELNVLSSYQSATGSGTALTFEGTQGQLFGITDNLSSGTIFSVSDITGLPSIEVNSDGQVKICEYGSGTLLFNDLTGNDSLINISGVALGVSGIRFSDNTTLTTAPMTNFILEDDSGDEVTILNGKEVKFIGAGGLTIDWTDVSDGSDGDPYDLTFTIGTLNQNTTGSAATLTTSRNINGVAFDGSASITVPAAGSTLSDTVPVSKGGTNATSFADKAVLITQDTGTDTVSAAAMSTNGQLLIGGTSGPAVATLTEGSNITITNADGAITIAAAGGTVSGDTFATDLKIGRDSQNLVDFATTDNKIILRANNVDQVSLIDNVFGPEADSDVDLGTTSVRWKDAYIDSITTTGKITAGGSINQAPNTATDGGIIDIDCSTSNYHEILMNADATRINFTNVTAGQRVIVRFKQHSSHIDLNSSEGFNDVDVNGSNATIKWAGGIVPTLTESNNAVDVYGFIFESTVTNVMAFIIGQDIK